MTLLYFFIAGLALYFLLRFGFRLARAFLQRFSTKESIIQIFPFVEGLLWVLYLFWGGYLLFGNIKHYDILLLILAILVVSAISWFFFRDYFSGIVIRSDYRLTPGQHIKTPIVEGIITAMGSRYIEVENERGEKTRLPYSLFGKQWVTLPADHGKPLSKRLMIPIAGETDITTLRTAIENKMMEMPWVVGSTPEIKVTKDSNNQLVFEIRYNLLVEEHMGLVEKQLRQFIKEKESI